MNKTPPHIVIVIIWGVLLVYLTFNFIGKANVNFVQFNYNWAALEVLDTIYNVEIDSISHDYISFKNNFILPGKYNSNNTFLLKNNQDSYFRTSDILLDSTQIVFSGVKWINQIPDYRIKKGTLEILDLPIIQPNGKTMLTIGDSQIIWREARELRRNLVSKKKLFFVGSQTDAYGYPYLGGTFDTSSEILKEIPKAPPSEYVILFFGAQDKGVAKEVREHNICKILELFQNKDTTEKIFAITLPPSTKTAYNEFNDSFNARLKECADQYAKIQIVDFNSFLRDKSNYLSADEVHLNKNGYLYLNKLLTQEIP